MKQYRIPLDSPINQTFYDSGFGFYIEDYPVGLQGYIICDNNPNTLRQVTAQRVIRYTDRFAFWTLSTVSSHPGEYLDIWVIETESEFGVLPTQTQYLNVTLSDTDVATETTQSQILSELQTNIAKETTLQSANTNTVEIKNILSELQTNMAKETTLQSIDTKIIKADTDRVLCKIISDILDGNGYFYMINNNANIDILITNPAGSGKRVIVYNYFLSNTGTANVTLSLYANSTYTGTATTLTFFNKQVGSTNTHTFTAEDITGTTITPGTLLGSIVLNSNNFFKFEYNSFGVIEILEGNALHISIQATDVYNFAIDIVEE